jgi:hypothetical protein
MYQMGKNDSYTTGFLIQGVLLGALWLGSLLFSVPSHADPVLDTPNGIEPHVGAVESMDDELEDGALARVHGKGAESNLPQSGPQLAVILWDEHGNGTRRTTRNDENPGWNSQNVSLTVNRR